MRFCVFTADGSGIRYLSYLTARLGAQWYRQALAECRYQEWHDAEFRAAQLAYLDECKRIGFREGWRVALALLDMNGCAHPLYLSDLEPPQYERMALLIEGMAGRVIKPSGKLPGAMAKPPEVKPMDTDSAKELETLLAH